MAMGRKKQFTERITLPLPAGTTCRIDALLDKGEARLELIRDAIEREVRRRERRQPQKKPTTSMD